MALHTVWVRTGRGRATHHGVGKRGHMSPTAPAPSSPSAHTTPVEVTPPRPPRGRSVAAVICVVLAGLLTTPAAVAYWGQRTLNDAERYIDTVGPLVDSPEVQDVIATKVTEAIQQ